MLLVFLATVNFDLFDRIQEDLKEYFREYLNNLLFSLSLVQFTYYYIVKPKL